MQRDVRASVDWERAAADWERVEPRTAKVSEAIAHHMGEVSPGELILDLACGMGEPGISVQRAHPGSVLLGVDSSPAMIDAARGRAERDGLVDARFEVMDMASLPLGTASVDAMTSRFGFVNLENTAAEAARVLKPGGPYAFAVWDDPELNVLLSIGARAIEEQVGAGAFPPIAALGALADGRRERWLENAGMGAVQTALFHWTFRLDDDATVAALMDDAPFGPVYRSLDGAGREAALSAVLGDLQQYRADGGGYRLPNTCRLMWGRR